MQHILKDTVPGINPKYISIACKHVFEEKALDVLVNCKLNRSQQCALAIQQANSILDCTSCSIASGSRQGIFPLCTVLLRPYLQYYAQFWAAQYNRGAESAATPADTHQDGQAGGHSTTEGAERACVLSQEKET